MAHDRVGLGEERVEEVPIHLGGELGADAEPGERVERDDAGELERRPGAVIAGGVEGEVGAGRVAGVDFSGWFGAKEPSQWERTA